MIGPSQSQPDEVVRAREDLVMELGVEEALEAADAIRALTLGQGGIDEVAPIAVDDGKIAQDLARRKNQSGAKFVCAKLEAKIFGLGSANGAHWFERHRMPPAAIPVFMECAAKKIGQRARDFRPTQKSDDLGFGNSRFLLKATRRDTIFYVRLGAAKRSEFALQHIAAMIGERQPTVGRRGNGTNGTNFAILAMQADDAEGRPHARDFRDKQLVHGMDFGFLRRSFKDCRRAAIRWRISTLWPCTRQCAASRSATRRR